MRASWGSLRERLVESTASCPNSQFAQLKGTDTALARFSEPLALVAFTSDRASPLPAKDAVVAALVRAVQAGGALADLAGRLLWLALWHQLDGIFRKAQWRSGTDETEVLSEFEEMFTRTIAAADLRRIQKPYATLPLNLDRRLIEARRRRQAEEARRRDLLFRQSEDDDEPAGDPLDEFAAPAVRSVDGRILVLGPWLDAGHDLAALRAWLALRLGRDAELVLRGVVLQEEYGEVGREFGLSADAVRKRCGRALDVLRDELRAEYGRAERAREEGAVLCDGDEGAAKKANEACPVSPAGSAFRN